MRRCAVMKQLWRIELYRTHTVRVSGGRRLAPSGGVLIRGSALRAQPGTEGRKAPHI